MALQTLTGKEQIGGFTVVDMDVLREKNPEKFNESGSMDYKWFEKDIRPNNFVYIRHDVNSISFTLQNGPIKEHGVNGCQVDTMIEAAKAIIEGLNAQFPCRENSAAITKLDEALHWLEHRKKNRIARGVEGFNKAQVDPASRGRYRAKSRVARTPYQFWMSPESLKKVDTARNKQMSTPTISC